MTGRQSRASSAARPVAPRRDEGPDWYKDAVLYELRVGAYQDSDGDGIGDFRGLTERLDYLRDLGVTALWLLPFYPSPWRDDGYDIADYESVHPDCGTLEDFRTFLEEAHKRRLRVITELVLNHTSEQHPWFQRARRAPAGSPERDFYVWSDTAERYRDARIIFKDFERSNWTWDPVAKAYYWHRFFSHQPDLNYDNPDVRRAVLGVLDFWLGLGVDGLRLDAVPYLVEREGTNCENLVETHAILKEVRAHVDAHYRDRMLLAEANQWPEDAVAYFGAGDECHMAFHFPVMPRLFMALYMEDRLPIVDIMAQTPPIPESCQWALFLRNHDELTLEMVTDEERDYMYRVYANDARARVNLGIRRRLAPLLGNDRRRMELMNALLVSLPGTPVIYYGDEIGMGDNIYLGDRNGVRTPMQWSSDRNAGFSRGNPQRLYLPVVIDPEYHYESLNVEAQQNNPHSILLWMRRLIALRKQHPAFGRGSIEFLGPRNAKVLAFIRHHRDEHVLVVANLSRFVQYVELDLSAYTGAVPVELFGRNAFPSIGTLPYLLTLGPHAFYWFELTRAPATQAAATAAGESTPHVRLAGEVSALARTIAGSELEGALAAVLPRHRWFIDKGSAVKSLKIVEAVALPGDATNCLAIASVELTRGWAASYALALRFVFGEEAVTLRRDRPAAVLAEVELAGAEGVLQGLCIDGGGDPVFMGSLLDVIARRRKIGGAGGTFVAATTPVLKNALERPDPTPPATPFAGEQSNSSVRFGDRVALKLYRRLHEGTNPDVEIGRFLTRRRFAHMAPLAGTLDYEVARREPISVALLQSFVPNEGDLWRYTLDQLAQYVERVLVRAEKSDAVPVPSEALMALTEVDPPPLVTEVVGAYLETARVLGQRIAELHRALGSDSEDAAFAPEPFGLLQQRGLYQSFRNLAGDVFRRLREITATLPPEAAGPANRLLKLEPQLLDTARALMRAPLSGQRIRLHGDLHLGQVLRTRSDFVVIDFEGEPMRTLGERRLKRTPLRDVAGMIRSFDYAVHTASLDAVARGVAREPDLPRLGRWMAFWRAWASSAFLRAYRQTMEGSGLLPTTRQETDALLRFTILEKSIYEVGYELGARPAWVGIPIRGILDLLGA